MEKWLERIPFLTMKDFDFISKYEGAINNMLEEEASVIESADLSDEDKNIRLRMTNENRKYYKRVLDEDIHNKAIEDGETKLSYRATMSALLINLYRDHAILHLPYKFLRSLVELDHKISSWRFRHMQMVEKMLGQKIGTGGSSGQGYLKQTVDKYKLFTDLANISTLMISRKYLPELPTDTMRALGFNYSN